MGITAMPLPRYVIAPDPRGGSRLSGPLIPWPLLYENEITAASYAYHIARDSGGNIIFLDSTGWVVITEIIPKDPPRPCGYGMTG